MYNTTTSNFSNDIRNISKAAEAFKHSQMCKCKVRIQDLDSKKYHPSLKNLTSDNQAFLYKSSDFNWLLVFLWVAILKLSRTGINKINSSKMEMQYVCCKMQDVKYRKTSLCVGTNFHGIPSAMSALNCTTISLKKKNKKLQLQKS